MAPDPPRGRGPTSPEVLQPPTSELIETLEFFHLLPCKLIEAQGCNLHMKVKFSYLQSYHVLSFDPMR